MADKKISELVVATTLADADVVPVVQGGVTKKVAVSVIKSTVNPSRTTVVSVVDTDMVLLDGNRQITIANLKTSLGI